MWINPECDRALGIAVSVTVQALEAAFATAAARQLKVGAVLVVSPSYFGSCSDIAGGHACPCLSTLLEQARKMFLYVQLTILHQVCSCGRAMQEWPGCVTEKGFR